MGTYSLSVNPSGIAPPIGIASPTPLLPLPLSRIKLYTVLLRKTGSRGDFRLDRLRRQMRRFFVFGGRPRNPHPRHYTPRRATAPRPKYTQVIRLPPVPYACHAVAPPQVCRLPPTCTQASSCVCNRVRGGGE